MLLKVPYDTSLDIIWHEYEVLQDLAGIQGIPRCGVGASWSGWAWVWWSGWACERLRGPDGWVLGGSKPSGAGRLYGVPFFFEDLGVNALATEFSGATSVQETLGG